MSPNDIMELEWRFDPLLFRKRGSKLEMSSSEQGRLFLAKSAKLSQQLSGWVSKCDVCTGWTRCTGWSEWTGRPGGSKLEMSSSEQGRQFLAKPAIVPN